MEDQVLLGHGSGGTMMKRIIDEVFFTAYAGEELLRGDDAAVLDIAPGMAPAIEEKAPGMAPATEEKAPGMAPATEKEAPGTARAAEGGTSGAIPVTGEIAPGTAPATGEEAPTAPPSARESAPDATSASGKEAPSGRHAAPAAVRKAPTPQLAFSTDSFVVTPHFFPGGDIGRLAICGTVNDIATSGARPLYLSCGFILEEGFPMDDLRRICASMAEAAAEAGVRLVTGDTKVVNRGHGDGVFINTSGIGVLPAGVRLSGAFCQPGDKVLVSGTLGDHGITIMSCRESLSFTANVKSDAAPLNHLIANVLAAADGAPGAASGSASDAASDAASVAGPDASGFGAEAASANEFDADASTGAASAGASATRPTAIGLVRCFRDPTRGGLASTLNELAEQSGVDISIDEDAIPVNDAVRGACDMLGYDVLQVANEGKMVCVVAPEAAGAALRAMRESKYGENAAIIGEVSECKLDRDPKVYVRNAFGGRRILDMLVGEQLPRIC